MPLIIIISVIIVATVFNDCTRKGPIFLGETYNTMRLGLTETTNCIERASFE